MKPPTAETAFDIVLIDEDYSTRRLLELTIRSSWGHRVQCFRALQDYLGQESTPPDVLLFGLFPGEDDPAAQLRRLHHRFPGLPVILLCSREDHDTAAALLTKGAWDYFTRPVDLLRLRAALRRIADIRQLLERIALLEERLGGEAGAAHSAEGAAHGAEGAAHSAEGAAHGAEGAAHSAEGGTGAVLTMDEARENAIRRALRASRGNVKEAARLLGIGRTTIYKLMEKYRIRHRSDDAASPRRM